MAPPKNLILRAALQRYVASGRERDTNELVALFGAKSCTVLFPIRVRDKTMKEPPEFPTILDPELGPLVHVHTIPAELPKYDGVYTTIVCTVLDLMGDLLLGADVGVVFDPGTPHAVYFRFNGPEWVVRTVERLRAEKRMHLN